jgi:hypothetical protein
MELVSLAWTSGRSEDRHLMRGRSGPVDLADGLLVDSRASPASGSQTQVLSEFLTDNPNAAITFRPTFKSDFNTGTNEFEGFGVRVNSQTGVVEAGAHTGSFLLYNFVVVATIVADRTDPDSPRKRAYLRIHLHNFVSKAWLSPTRMRVPKNISGFNFSVFAQFDDRTIARLRPLDVIDWFSDPPGKVNNDSGFISLDNSDADESTINVRAVLTVDLKDAGGGDVEAKGVAIPYTLPQVARLIPGSAGYDQRNEVPNFIFLADGFQAFDQARFNAMIDTFMRDLRQNDKFKPFDRLVGRMNFWKAFVPSAARGIGTRFEVYGEGKAQPLPICPSAFDVVSESPLSEDDLIDQSWGPNQVRHYFGLPVLPHKDMPNDDVRDYWDEISPLPSGLIDLISDDLINEWKKLGDRRLVDESDTFLGTFYGTPTRAKALPMEDRTLKKTLYRENDQRFERLTLNQFLRNLHYRDENGALHPLGPLWEMFAAPPDGRNADYVIILLCANSGRVLNTSGQLYTNVIDDERSYVGIEANAAVNDGFSQGRAVKMTELDSDRLPAILPLMPGKTTLLHEIAHSLGLGDEYGERSITKEDPRLMYTGTGDMESDRHFSNVQVKSDLVITPGGDELNVAKIKWRWHRIAKSGVLAQIAPPAPAAITRNGSQYTIRLKPGQAAFFKQGNIVILRHRRMSESILQDIEYPQISPRYPFVTRSPELEVVQVPAGGSDVVVQAVDAATLTGHDLAADFPADCVLYEPKPARYFYEPAGENLEMIAANVLEFMAGTQRPVYEKLDSLGQPDLDFDSEQTPDLSDPALAEIMGISGCAKKNRDIVALYAGGNTYHHGVYHATGHCIMRDNHEIAEFCAVCKYILTDYIDPSLHPQVDRLFDKHYPLKEL